MKTSQRIHLPRSSGRLSSEIVLLLLALLYLAVRLDLAHGATQLGESKPSRSSLWSTAYQTHPGEAEQIGYGAGAMIPEIHRMPDFSRFVARFVNALTPDHIRTNSGAILPPFGIMVNTMVEKQFETKNRLDLKGWVLSMLMQGGDAFMAVDPHLSREEIAYQEAFKARQEYNIAIAKSAASNSADSTNPAKPKGPLIPQPLDYGLTFPLFVIEAEIAALDEGILSKNTGMHVDFLIDVSGPKTNLQVKANPSLGLERSMINNTLLVHVRVKRFLEGRYVVGGSAIIAATLAERGQSLDLGLWVQGSGGGFKNKVDIRPAVQQAILRCTSRAVMVALGRALDIPYWHVLTEFPEDEAVNRALRARLAKLDPQANQETLARIQVVLENPVAPPASHYREDVNAVMDALTSSPREPSAMRLAKEEGVLIEIVGFAEADRYRLIDLLQKESGTRLSRQNGWSYHATVSPALARPKSRQQWAKRLCAAVPSVSGSACRVMELAPNHFQLVNQASF